MSRQQVSCPEPLRLRELLDGSLSSREQSELTGHLETCLDCQHTLDRLAADSACWDGAARHLDAGKDSPELALRAAMEALKGQAREPDQTGAPVAPDELTVEFLEPSDQPGHLGRLDHY